MKKIFILFWLVCAFPFFVLGEESAREKLYLTFKEQFRPFEKQGVTQASLDNIFYGYKDLMPDLMMARFQIIDNKLYGASYTDHPYYDDMTYVLTRVLDKYKLPNIDFMIILSDGVAVFPNSDINDVLVSSPIFVMSKDLLNPYERDLPLFPDSYMIRESLWERQMSKILKASFAHPWEKKEPVIFWRGSTTGGEYFIGNEKNLPRFTLVEKASHNSDYIDAKFTILAQFTKDAKGDALKNKILELQGGEAPFVKPEEHLKYKYLISIDGNVCAWLRVPWILLSNSVLLKQETTKVEWFYPILKPYEHYIPLKEDLSDLEEIYDWAIAHDDEARQISQNATQFIFDFLSPDEIDAQIAFILKEYAKLQKFDLLEPAYPELKPKFSLFKKMKALIANLHIWFYRRVAE